MRLRATEAQKELLRAIHAGDHLEMEWPTPERQMFTLQRAKTGAIESVDEDLIRTMTIAPHMILSQHNGKHRFVYRLAARGYREIGLSPPFAMGSREKIIKTLERRIGSKREELNQLEKELASAKEK